MERLYSLDYLRGLCAFGIMIYHYLSWDYGEFGADSFMGRLGIYGVSIFYVLSGLTLYYVYYNQFKITKLDILTFFKKRFFRIFPLLWLVNIFSLIYLYFFGNYFPSLKVIFLNFTGLFGFVGWWAYIATGAWSIGNELVFYVFFPFFIYFTRNIKWGMVLLSLILFVIYLYFAFEKIQPHLDISEQWKDYVNPLNQVFLFLCGFLLGHFFKNIKLNNSFLILLLVLSLVVFVYYPASGNEVILVTQIQRIVFTIICLVICLCFYRLSVRIPQVIHTPLVLLGEMSYSVYLIHPIVWKFSKEITSKLKLNQNVWGYFVDYQLFVNIIITFSISYFVYKYFELYFMKLGKRLKLFYF